VSDRKSNLYPPYRAHESMRMDLQPVPKTETKDYPIVPGSVIPYRTEDEREAIQAAIKYASAEVFADTDPPPELMCRRGEASEHARRKAQPVTRGVLDYFPDALLAVAEVSLAGNEQHHPGSPLYWEEDKSTDHQDCLVRHLLDRGTLDKDGMSHTAKVAWRALALLQTELEAKDKELHVRRQGQRDRAKEGKR